MKYLIITTVLFFLFGCKSTNISNLNTPHKKGTNTVVKKGESLNSSEKNQDKVIFKGKDNVVILEYFNTFFNDVNSKDVIIIEGNGNTFKLSHQSGIDNSENSCDTIILKGDNNHIELLQSYFLDNSKNSDDIQVFEFNDHFELKEISKQAQIIDSTKIQNQLTNEWVFVNDAFDSYIEESIKGNNQALFFLGEMYQIGVGTKINIKKAEYYYLISAKKGFKDAQSQLGYIYENDWVDISKDLTKAKYWYLKAAKQGDEFAIEQLKKF